MSMCGIVFLAILVVFGFGFVFVFDNKENDHGERVIGY